MTNAANTYDEIADMLARRCWYVRHGANDKGKNCPSNMIPTARDLVSFVRESGVVMYTETKDSGFGQDVVFGDLREQQRIGYLLHAIRHVVGEAAFGVHYCRPSTDQDVRKLADENLEKVDMTEEYMRSTVERFHVRRRGCMATLRELNAKAKAEREETGVPPRMLAEGGQIALVEPAAEFKGADIYDHYVQMLIDLWQVTPKKIQPFTPVTKASLPRINRIDHEGTRELPTFDALPNPKSDDGQLELLPLGGLGESAVSWLLRLYNEVGGSIMRKGKGAPYQLRLFIAALLHLHVGYRDGHIWRVDVRTNRVIEWLHPNGWSNKRRDWRRLPEALMAIRSRLNAVSIKGVGSVQLMTVAVIPEQPTDPWVRFALMVPMQAAKGVRIDWPRLCEYGTMNAPLYCAYLSASVAMDESARKGTLLTKDIHAPILDARGNPKRRGGKIIRSANELVPNPSARFVHGYSKDDLTRMAGMDPKDHNHRFRAMDAFNRLHDDGVIDLQRDGSDWRIFGPRGDARRVSL